MSTAVSAPSPGQPAGPAPDRFLVRLIGVGAVVFLANAGLLVLQLVAGRLLSPFIGSSLGTWTAVIASFLTGIALGNFLGGWLAARRPSAGKLAAVLLAGVLGTLWMVGLPMLLKATDAHASLGLSLRIPVLAFLLCLPVATVLSLLTPLAIRFGVPDVARTGRVAGTVFALSTLGCLLGNYLTGFVLIPELTINAIVFAVAGLLAVTGAGTLLLGGGGSAADEAGEPVAVEAEVVGDRQARRVMLPLAAGCGVVFLCSFAGMALEMAGFRLMARLLGVSVFTLTGVIGVMLAGTCLGNWFGGRLADRAHRTGGTGRGQVVLGTSLLAAAVFTVLVLLVFAVVSNASPVPFSGLGLIGQVVALTFVLFFLPMALLGTISPQVIRLCVRDAASAGQTAGQVYAVSTGGAILGTFAAGYVFISTFGTQGTVLIAAVLPAIAVLLLNRVWKEPATLYVASAVGGAFLGGAVLIFRGTDGLIETNYYAIQVTYEPYPPVAVPGPIPRGAAVGGMPDLREKIIGSLVLDRLLHSDVSLNDPTYFKYRHEQVQLEAVYAAADRTPTAQRLLVIGGGGYTLPRATRTLLPTATVDVVEIDPGVTRVAYDKLGLDPKLGVRSFNRDGRQYVAEVAEPGSYDVVSLDAVNDYSVPAHLLTKECNDAVKRTLAPGGAYLVTVIDRAAEGKLWRAAYNTLAKSFKHVYFTLPLSDVDDRVATDEIERATALANGLTPKYAGPVTRASAVQNLDRVVIVLYATDTPLDLDALNATVKRRTGEPSDTYVLPDAAVKELLAREKELALTDQYAPVDNLMIGVFLKSERGK